MTPCFRKSNSSLISDTSTVDAPCSLITTSEVVSPCCPTVSDSSSLCLSDYLCWWGNDMYQGGTNFITASCTDSTYESSECTEHCADNPVPDVIYNTTTGLWACCSWSSETGTDCANPTNETFAAPAPQVLLSAASISSSITGAATSSITSLTTSPTALKTNSSLISTITKTSSSSSTSAASSSNPSSSSSSGLSSGAKAGIAVGVVLGVVLLALAFFCTWRQGTRSRQRRGAAQYRDNIPSAMEMHSNSTNELPATVPRVDGRKALVELQ